MFYAMSNGVYLVEGRAKSCIYDLNASKLYSINNALAAKLKEIVAGKPIESICDDEIENILKRFEKLGLVEQVESPRKNDISEIRDNNNQCQFAWIEITSKCNLRCIHCYNESEALCEKVMSVEDFKIVVDSILKIGIKRIQIIGGEPFFNQKALKSMLNYVIGKFDFIEIFTNGTLISDEWFEFLACNNIHIALSVYSYNPQMHDKVTGSVGSHEKTNRTIEKLRTFNIKYRVCNVLMNVVDLGESKTDLYTLSEDKDVVRMTGRANFHLLSDELIKKRLITKETFQKPIPKAFCKRLISGHNCFKDKIYISAEMDVFPCVMERRIKHCKIDDTREIILNDAIKNFNKDQIADCASCEFRYACFDCRPNSLAGNLTEKPWYCTYDPQSGGWMDTEEFIAALREKWGN